MKSGIIAIIFAGVVVVAGITYSFIRNYNSVDNVDSEAVKLIRSSQVVHVDELAISPEDFRGEFMLRGVVAGVRKTEGIFAVIDSREFELCGELTCAANTIPVKFDGQLPDLKAIVEITGRVVQSEKGLIIDARRLEIGK